MDKEYCRLVKQWVIAEYACYVYSMLSIPIYNTFGHESVKTVLAETALTVIVIDTLDKIRIFNQTSNRFQKIEIDRSNG
uniref:Uncharacterized protein n=1 Tax=Romanomermis culicivorax TaxID=13658 RepID=A0A915IWP6_ROMCU